MTKQFTKKQIDDITSRFKKGYGFADCARAAGVQPSNPDNIAAVIRTLGENRLIYTGPDGKLPKGRRQCTRVVRKSTEIVERYKNKESVSDIAEKTNLSYQAVATFLKEADLFDSYRNEHEDSELRRLRKIESSEASIRTQIPEGFKQLNILVPEDLFARVEKLSSERNQYLKYVACDLLERGLASVNSAEKTGKDTRGFFSKLFGRE